MNILKTALVAATLTAATVAGAANASAAERIVVGNHHARIVATVHRAPAVRVVHRSPILIGGWYAEPTVYHPYAYYRGNPRLRACFQVTQRGFSGAHRALISATMCYGPGGNAHVVQGSRHVVRFL